MPTLPRPDYPSRKIEDLARIFEYFGEIECPQLDAYLYRAFCRGIQGDEEMLSLAAHAPPTQPPPNLLFASAHYLLLLGAAHPLRDFYPEFGGDSGGESPPAEAYSAFRGFCLEHRATIAGLIETRMTQTNVVQRTSGLLPAFAQVAASSGGAPLSLVEIGASAGLNLHWDRFRYEYRSEGGEAFSWGDPNSSVRIPCELRGAPPAWSWPTEIPVASRRGIDLNPIATADEDAVLWLRALVWPEHLAAHDRLRAAIEVARRDPPELVQGDAATGLATLLAEAPGESALCVYGTHTLYQFPRPALLDTLRAMERASRERPVDFLSIEGTGDRHSELQWTRYRDGERETRLVGRCNPHGYWLEWLGEGEAA